MFSRKKAIIAAFILTITSLLIVDVDHGIFPIYHFGFPVGVITYYAPPRSSLENLSVWNYLTSFAINLLDFVVNMTFYYLVIWFLWHVWRKIRGADFLRIRHT